MLHTITKDFIEMLMELVTFRIAIKHPLLKLRSYSFDMIPVDKLDWLREHVQLEEQ
jgi:hypothetical protein